MALQEQQNTQNIGMNEVAQEMTRLTTEQRLQREENSMDAVDC